MYKYRIGETQAEQARVEALVTGGDSGPVQFRGAKANGTADAASAVIMGGGTSAAPVLSSTANDKFLEFRCKTTATSGDNRLAYLRYEQAGAGGGGECIRAFTKATAALGTARGAHISFDMGDSGGSVSGLGVGVDAQLLIGNHAVSTGTLFAGQSEVYMSGASSNVPSSHAIHSIKANGNATGVGKVLNAIAFAGSTGTGKMIYNSDSTGSAESNGSIRILVDEGSGYVARYLRYWDAEN